jgi:tetratricopeptide (TPR) repeat protein
MPRGEPYPISREQDRELGVWCFNRTWDLIEKSKRSPEEDEEMLATAYASSYHWQRAGTAVNFARSEWQIARVYGLLGRHEEAVRHARRCLEITEGAGLGDFDLAAAYEGMARSLALMGHAEQAREFAKRAAAAGAQIAAEEDRQIFVADLATLPVSPDE